MEEEIGRGEGGREWRRRVKEESEGGESRRRVEEEGGGE